jgi:tRNA threonylcarbamoyladenosine biosynthesis protein TsaB
VCPLLDARKGEVYCSLYRWSGTAMVREWDYLAVPPAAAAARLEAPVIVLGDGIAACRPHLVRLGAGLREAPPAQSLPSAAVVGALGHEILSAGGGIAAERLAPLYLRPSEAELRARHA